MDKGAAALGNPVHNAHVELPLGVDIVEVTAAVGAAVVIIVGVHKAVGPVADRLVDQQQGSVVQILQEGIDVTGERRGIPDGHLVVEIQRVNDRIQQRVRVEERVAEGVVNNAAGVRPLVLNSTSSRSVPVGACLGLRHHHDVAVNDRINANVRDVASDICVVERDVDHVAETLEVVVVIGAVVRVGERLSEPEDGAVVDEDPQVGANGEAQFLTFCPPSRSLVFVVLRGILLVENWTTVIVVVAHEEETLESACEVGRVVVDRLSPCCFLALLSAVLLRHCKADGHTFGLRSAVGVGEAVDVLELVVAGPVGAVEHRVVVVRVVEPREVDYISAESVKELSTVVAAKVDENVAV
mmetsp:Transcript_10680/g.43785  ORF Transcript_10680/g.43785 Transcript_10680/m.43785 type:complete len:355 (+) Transcript_10680:1966-3030(+)